ncbi:hypothetical protein [Streptomyces sp. NPDC058240]|uniref:hypothetical protein n=1 Tax=Streptomyces sp. NPDC058240 TaxID=3346396 RepID=UPI0036E2E850
MHEHQLRPLGAGRPAAKCGDDADVVGEDVTGGDESSLKELHELGGEAVTKIRGPVRGTGRLEHVRCDGLRRAAQAVGPSKERQVVSGIQ